MKRARLFIGTSGWSHKEWGETFFPKDLPPSEHLSYLARHFNTVEVNFSFYRLPPEGHFEAWNAQTPKDFVFAVKVSRYITHIQRMKDVLKPWKLLVKNARPLGKKQGPFLFQFPSFFTGREDQVQRIEGFLKEAKKDGTLRLAFEFRHQDCFSDKMLKVLKEHNAALVIANSSEFPTAPLESTADFVYFRLHGPRKMFDSSYSDRELKDQAKLMEKFLKEGKDVYVYFNNDRHAHATENAQLLQKILKTKRK